MVKNYKNPRDQNLTLGHLKGTGIVYCLARREWISGLWTYNLYGSVHNAFAFDVGNIQYEGKWEGVGPWKSTFLDPVKWHQAVKRVPLQCLSRIKTNYLQFRINQRSIVSFMYMSSRAHTSALGELKKNSKNGGKESAARLLLVYGAK